MTNSEERFLGLLESDGDLMADYDEPPDAETYQHECYYCDSVWFDGNRPTRKDDCGICDPEDSR